MAPGLAGQTIERAEALGMRLARSDAKTPELNVDNWWITVRLHNVVSSRPGSVLFRPGYRRRGPGLCPGPRGAALLWGLSPAGPFILGPLPPGRAGPRVVPWTWIGQTPRQAAT